MSKHTSGPWVWNEDNQLISATESYPLQSYEDESDRKPILIVETDSGFYPPRGPDRLLLAAAPELLAALISLDEAFCSENRTREERHQSRLALIAARAAVAKATGSA